MMINATIKKTILIMGGGTGGHVFPGLAVAMHLKNKGWNIVWLGSKKGIEYTLVKKRNIQFESIFFIGVSGKSLKKTLYLPFYLIHALIKSFLIFKRIRPNIVLGMGGYIAFPGALVSIFLRKPLILHEQNLIAGLTNTLLSRFSKCVISGFPCSLPNTLYLGNPLFPEMIKQKEPKERYSIRSGKLKILILGGSLGSQSLNQIVPMALRILPKIKRPEIIHQSGEKHFLELKNVYKSFDISADVKPFIEDMANVYAQADLVICRSGAMTVSEIIAVGVAAHFIPFPYSTKNHQFYHAQFLTNIGAAHMIEQKNFHPIYLAKYLEKINRLELMKMAIKAKKISKLNATENVARVCENTSI